MIRKNDLLSKLADSMERITQLEKSLSKLQSSHNRLLEYLKLYEVIEPTTTKILTEKERKEWEKTHWTAWTYPNYWGQPAYSRYDYTPGFSLFGGIF